MHACVYVHRVCSRTRTHGNAARYAAALKLRAQRLWPPACCWTGLGVAGSNDLGRAAGPGALIACALVLGAELPALAGHRRA